MSERPEITGDEDFAENRWYSHNTLCSIFEDMRTCCKTLNFGPLPALIEEAQMMADRIAGDACDVRGIYAAETR